MRKFVLGLKEYASQQVDLSLGLSQWKFTKGIWNKTIEPFFIDLVDNFVGGALRGLIKGLRSDK